MPAVGSAYFHSRTEASKSCSMAAVGAGRFKRPALAAVGAGHFKRPALTAAGAGHFKKTSKNNDLGYVIFANKEIGKACV